MGVKKNCWMDLAISSTGYIIMLVKFPNTCSTLSPNFDLGVYLGKGWSYRESYLRQTPVWSKMDYDTLCDTPEIRVHGDFTHRLLQASEWLSNPISPTNMSYRKESAIDRNFSPPVLPSSQGLGHKPLKKIKEKMTKYSPKANFISVFLLKNLL